jgi:hypothetical protein
MRPSAQAAPERFEEIDSSAHSPLIGLQARASRKPITWEVIKSRICPPKSAPAADFLSLGAKSGALIGTTSNTAQSDVAAQKLQTNQKTPCCRNKIPISVDLC